MKNVFTILVALLLNMSLEAQISYSIWGGMNPDDQYLGYCADIDELEFYEGYVVYMDFFDYSGQQVYIVDDCYWDENCYPIFYDGCNGVFDADPAEIDLAATIMTLSTCSGWETYTPDIVTETGIEFHTFSCTFGCDDPAADNYESEADFPCSNLCYYDPNDACQEDESLFEIREYGLGAVWGIEVVVEDEFGNQIYPNGIPANVTYDGSWNETINYVCLTNYECYLLTYSTSVNGWEGTFYVEGYGFLNWENDLDYEPISSLYPSSCFGTEICDDPSACNYFQLGSDIFNPCCYENCGCTDEEALNFESVALCDDGTCILLFGDANGDLEVNVLDVIAATANFGCMDDCFEGDANGDGVVNVMDILTISTFWGSSL